MVALTNSIDSFEEVEESELRRTYGELLKVREKIDVQQSLNHETNIKLGAMAKEKCIPVTYEKLSDFCYNCGILGHVLQECEVKVEGPGYKRIKIWSLAERF